jgi:DNA-binding NtrC family response regulator
MANILVIDDDTNILAVIQTRLEANGHVVETYSDPFKALESLREKEFDCIVSDVRMPKMDGMELLRRVQRLRWNIPVVLLTAFGTIPSAVEAMKQGAYQYLTKPFQGRELVQEIEGALAERGRIQKATASEVGKYFPGVYGVSPKMKALYPMLESIIESDSTVLIQGESGTGKELIAQMIHYNGIRRDNRFLTMDFGATASSLIESELFGHAKGSFTNATESRKGIFELAHKGTIFLDEIGSLPLDLQTRLLRVLQEGEIKRVGENLMRAVDVRIIAATNVDLNEEVQNGRFRMDLYYRLAVLKVELPPLRERWEDIPLLADHFLLNFSRKMKKAPMQWDKDVPEQLMQYEWPGNIRELKNIIEAAVVFSKEKVLRLEDLHDAGLLTGPVGGAFGRRAEEDRKELPLPEFLEQQERKIIVEALEKKNWVQRSAAEELGISPRVMHYKIKKYKIDLPSEG